MILSFVNDMIRIFVKRLYIVALFGLFLVPVGFSYAEIIEYGNVNNENYSYFDGNAGYMPNNTWYFVTQFSENGTISNIKMMDSRHPSLSCSGFDHYIEVYENPINDVSLGTLVGTSDNVDCGTVLVSDGTSAFRNFDNDATDFPFSNIVSVNNTSTYLFRLRSSGGVTVSGQRVLIPATGVNYLGITSVSSFNSTLSRKGGAKITFGDPIPVFEPVFDFLGASTSPSDIFTAVTTGVTSTGATTWPLLTFLGIPAGFVIGRRLIILIRALV